MHIEVGVVESAKMVLSYGTAAAAFGYLAKQVWETVKDKGILSLVVRTLATTLLVLSFFEVLPHHPVGVSEVHFILGSTLFLIFGLAPAGIGLAAGLLIQGLFFAPFDLPNYAINVTTLLVPLFAMAVLAKKVIPNNVAYKDLSYAQTVKLSLAYQGGIISWVAFWAVYGQGFGAENLASVASFTVAYSTVVLLEPVVDIAVLAGAKTLDQLQNSGFVTARLYHAEA
ncbi:cobalt transporter [Candidatus Thiomargarita nelsonii]|uniref:Cobalt transporter n=1 Tax=Candidatus Thiomargarita nelsonii TaxID=1003181 RepID=A0A4E0RIG1_9GAMM|nr:cobalt transporter [Candidatus Thiomargarita nelsonii]